VVHLSVLDQSPVPAGSSPATAVANSVDLAIWADRWGFHRYWAAEHHAAPSHAGPAPEILIAHLTARTTGIRLGTGGVLLPYYSPLKVAEVFRVLEAIEPGRIDLGIGRAIRSGSPEFAALRWDAPGAEEPADFVEKVSALRSFLAAGPLADGPHAGLRVMPDVTGQPEIWVLGSSVRSAEAAGAAGLPYAYAHFLAPAATRDAISAYRRAFVGEEPKAIVGLGVYVAETEQEARLLHTSQSLFRERMTRGEVRPIPSPQTALDELGPSALEPEPTPDGQWPRYLVGDAAQVAQRIEEIAEGAGVDEVTLLTTIHDHQARLRSYRLLATEFDLKPRGIDGAAAGPGSGQTTGEHYVVRDSWSAGDTR